MLFALSNTMNVGVKTSFSDRDLSFQTAVYIY